VRGNLANCFSTTFDKIKFGESLSGACPKLYNCCTNNASSTQAAPLIKLIEAVTPCSEARLPTLYLWAGINMR